MKNQCGYAILLVIVFAAIVTWFVTKPIREQQEDDLLFHREVEEQSMKTRQQSRDFNEFLEWASKVNAPDPTPPPLSYGIGGKRN